MTTAQHDTNMFAGHIGVALAIGRAERRLNLGVLILAALLLDFLLWLFVLLGWESVVIPADFAHTHQPEFVFPYSHGLLAALSWSLLAGAATHFWYPGLSDGARLRGAGLVALAVFSHWLLDALVHAPELPVSREGQKLGLGLWNVMPIALTVEAILSFAGLGLFLSGSSLSRARRRWLTVLLVTVVALTVFGMTAAPPPPSVGAMASSSWITIAAISALGGWLGRNC